MGQRRGKSCLGGGGGWGLVLSGYLPWGRRDASLRRSVEPVKCGRKGSSREGDWRRRVPFYPLMLCGGKDFSTRGTKPGRLDKSTRGGGERLILFKGRSGGQTFFRGALTSKEEARSRRGGTWNVSGGRSSGRNGEKVDDLGGKADGQGHIVNIYPGSRKGNSRGNPAARTLRKRQDKERKDESRIEGAKKNRGKRTNFKPGDGLSESAKSDDADRDLGERRGEIL